MSKYSEHVSYYLPLVDCVLVEYERYAAIGLLLGELIIGHYTLAYEYKRACAYGIPVKSERKQCDKNQHDCSIVILVRIINVLLLCK